MADGPEANVSVSVAMWRCGAKGSSGLLVPAPGESQSRYGPERSYRACRSTTTSRRHSSPAVVLGPEASFAIRNAKLLRLKLLLHLFKRRQVVDLSVSDVLSQILDRIEVGINLMILCCAEGCRAI